MKRYTINDGNSDDNGLSLKEVINITDFSDKEVDNISSLEVDEVLEIDDLVITRTE